MTVRRILTILICCLFLPGSVSAGSWSSLRQNAANHNRASLQPIFPLTEIASLPNYYISPLIEGNILITAEKTTSGSRIVAYQLSTLKRLWEFSLDDQIPRQPLIYRGVVYFGTIVEPMVYALNLVTGKQHWQTRLPGENLGPRHSPVVMNDGVYVASSWLHKLSLKGEPQWSRRYDVQSPMATDGQSLYVRTHDKKIQKLDANGQVIWLYDTGTTHGTEPIIAGTSLYLGTYQKILALETETGQLRWSYSEFSMGPLIGNLAAADDRLFFATNAGAITALDFTGRHLWTNRFNSASNRGNGWQSPFIMAGDFLLIKASQSTHLILDGSDGQSMFSPALSQPDGVFQAIADDRIFLGTTDRVFMYDAAGWQAGQLSSPLFEKRRDPVLVIPGILESWLVNDQWQLDPIFHTFDHLLATFRLAGYVEDIDLFAFPYDWHQDNRVTADQLRRRITEIRAQTGADKVDLVSHSMGGLVARAYISGETYQEDVDELVTIGTPHHGSVKAYLTWEAGETGWGTLDTLKEQLIALEARQRGYGNRIVDYIQERMPSVGQLLPVFNYLERDSQLLGYQECDELLYPCNRLIERLDKQSDRFVARAKVYNFIGKMAHRSTLERLVIGPAAELAPWNHGKPINYPERSGYHEGLGDGTVLASSAHLDGVEDRVVDADHTGIVSHSASQVVKLLSGREVQLPITDPPLRYLFIKALSVQQLLITDQEGRRINDQHIDIPGSSYFTDNNLIFAVIPNPSQQTYKIQIEGQDGTSYQLESSFIEGERVIESSVVGTIMSDKPGSTEAQLMVNQDSAVFQPLENTSVASPSPELCLITPTPSL